MSIHSFPRNFLCVPQPTVLMRVSRQLIPWSAANCIAFSPRRRANPPPLPPSHQNYPAAVELSMWAWEVFPHQRSHRTDGSLMNAFVTCDRQIRRQTNVSGHETSRVFLALVLIYFFDEKPWLQSISRLCPRLYPIIGLHPRILGDISLVGRPLFYATSFGD